MVNRKSFLFVSETLFGFRHLLTLARNFPISIVITDLNKEIVEVRKKTQTHATR